MKIPGSSSSATLRDVTTQRFLDPRARHIAARCPRRDGVCPDVYNFGLTYNDARFRIDHRYSMRRSWLNSINNTTGERTCFRDNDRMDVSINYRLTRKLAVYFDWRNVSDEEELRYVGADQRINFHQTAGMSINAGMC